MPATAAKPIEERHAVPRDQFNDYTEDAAVLRREFLADKAGTDLSHVGQYSFEPALVRGNIENFIGVAQVPIGVAGPLKINGEHAKGDFYVPLATTEGALVASYNRGMRFLSACGGVKTTVVKESMQRAPVFSFADALQAREFANWLQHRFSDIKREADATSRVGRLINIDQFIVGPLCYLRFNYTTGDAAGQNMASKATYAACEWIRASYPQDCEYFLTGNVDTDKKHSHINVMMTRGRRVVAEVVIKREFMQKFLHIDSIDLVRMREVQSTGSFLSGSSANCAHAANGLAALFIATGQDAANIAESHAAITYTRLLPNQDIYWSITLPSLIVATYGGGTGLATQKQCLDLLGCYGHGKAQKFAEICAAVVLAGETSLVSAIVHGDWVTAHEQLGRNRP